MKRYLKGIGFFMLAYFALVTVMSFIGSVVEGLKNFMETFRTMNYIVASIILVVVACVFIVWTLYKGLTTIEYANKERKRRKAREFLDKKGKK